MSQVAETSSFITSSIYYSMAYAFRVVRCGADAIINDNEHPWDSRAGEENSSLKAKVLSAIREPYLLSDSFCFSKIELTNELGVSLGEIEVKAPTEEGLKRKLTQFGGAERLAGTHRWDLKITSAYMTLTGEGHGVKCLLQERQLQVISSPTLFGGREVSLEEGTPSTREIKIFQNLFDATPPTLRSGLEGTALPLREEDNALALTKISYDDGPLVSSKGFTSRGFFLYKKLMDLLGTNSNFWIRFPAEDWVESAKTSAATTEEAAPTGFQGVNAMGYDVHDEPVATDLATMCADAILPEKYVVGFKVKGDSGRTAEYKLTRVLHPSPGIEVVSIGD